jgi:hypothetical protein
MRRRQVGRRDEVVESAGGPDTQIVSYPCERSEVRQRGAEQQLVIVETAVHVVAVGRRIITQRTAITIQHGIDDRMGANDVHVVGAYDTSTTAFTSPR